MTTPTIGFVYPDHAAEDDYPYAARVLGCAFPVAHIYGTDLHAVPELLDLGSPARLAHGASLFAPGSIDAIVWACTSGSFVYGPAGAREQVDGLAAAAGVPATSTSFAFVDACRALDVRSVAVAASYPADVADLFRAFLAHAGIAVVGFGAAGIDTAAEVGALSDEEVRRFVLAHDADDADAVLVPDTAMHTLRTVASLGDELGKPVLTANQVTIWAGLSLVGPPPPAPELGTLFVEGSSRVAR